MKSAIRELLLNSFYLYLVQGLNYLLPLLTLPYLLVTLSAESFGMYSFAFAVSQIAILFVDFGFNISATKKIAENAENEEVVRSVFWRVIVIKLFFLIITFFFFSLLVSLIDSYKEYSSHVFLSFIMILGSAVFPIWWFQGLNKMKTLSIINACSKLVTFPLIFLLVKEGNDSDIAIVIQSLSFLIAGIVSVIFIFSKEKNYLNGQYFYSKQEYKEEIKESFPIFLSNSAISLYTNGLTIILGFFTTSSQVGLFGALERIVRVFCFGILGPINQACFPVIVREKKIDFQKAKTLFRYLIVSVSAIIVLMLLILYSFRSFVVQRFLSAYVGVEPLFNIFILMIIPIVLGGIFGQLGLLGLGDRIHKSIFSKIYISIGLLSIPISFLCVSRFYVNGAVFSMMLVETAIFVTLAYFVKKYKFA